MIESKDIRPTCRNNCNSLLNSQTGLLVFLTSVLLVRYWHIWQLGTIAIYMNLQVAGKAKMLLLRGLTASWIEFPPLPVLLMAAASEVTGSPPGYLLPLGIVLSHLCLACGFFYWLHSMRQPALLNLLALVTFLWLPGLNSYEGLDNLPALMAAAVFLLMLANLRGRQPTRLRAFFTTSLAALLPLIRTEYIVLTPLYLAGWLCSENAKSGRPGRTLAIAWSILVCLGLLAGSTLHMSFRWVSASEFNLAPRGYACWTFLDGTPSAWLDGDEVSERERILQGIKRFGHPASHNYSLASMIAEHPRETCSKFLLNLPRWCYELGRRHVVVPLPLALLGLLGAALVLMRSARRRTAGIRLLPAIAMILMTMPLSLLMVHAEYMIPAQMAMCVLIASGLESLAALADHGATNRRSAQRRQGAKTRRETCQENKKAQDCYAEKNAEASTPSALAAPPKSRMLMLACCAAMPFVCEFFLIRGGGTLPDRQDHRVIASWLDEQFANEQLQLITEPFDPQVDVYTHTEILNSWLRMQQRREHPHGLSVRWNPDYKMLDAVQLAASAPVKLDVILLWHAGWKDELPFAERLKKWRQLGYQLADEVQLENEQQEQYSVYILRHTLSGSDHGEPADP